MPSLEFYQILAPVYVQKVDGERKISFSISYFEEESPTNFNFDVRIIIRRTSVNGGAVTMDTRLPRTLTGMGLTGRYDFSFNFYDNKSTYDINGIYNILRDDTMIVEAQIYFPRGGNVTRTGNIAALSTLYYEGTGSNIPPPAPSPYSISNSTITIPNNPILDINNNGSFSASCVLTPNNSTLVGKTIIMFCQIKDPNGVQTALIQKSVTISSTAPQNVIFTATNVGSTSTNGLIYAWFSLDDPTPVSNTTSFTVVYPSPTVTIPTAPILSKTSSGVGLIHLSWTGSNPVDIERADNINGYSVLIGSLSSNSIDYDLGTSTNTYFFRVRSQNSAGYSNYSNVITFDVSGSAPPPAGTVPNPPIIASSAYSITDSNIVNVLISWIPVTNSTSYNIEYQAAGYSNYISYGDNNYNDVGNGKIGFSAPISGINGNYLFRVRAKNSTGYSNYSNILAVTKNIVSTPPPDPDTTPNPPIFTLINSSDPLLKLLRWEKQTGIITYNIESSSPITDPLWISIGGDFVVGVMNDIGSNLWGVNIQKGTQNGLWKYRIRAKNSIGYSNYSNVVSYTIGDTGGNTGGNNDNKNFLSLITRLFAMGTGLTLLGKGK